MKNGENTRSNGPNAEISYSTDFMVYATANESDYFIDYRNFLQIARYSPGRSLIHLVVVISEVNPRSHRDTRIARKFLALARKNPAFSGVQVFFKPNTGRDFSSFKLALEEINRLGAAPHAVCLFVNRSAFGPFEVNWYERYKNQIAITGSDVVGTTINLTGRAVMLDGNDSLHVQTYAFLAKVDVLTKMLTNFPGALETEKLKVIQNGEVGLTRQVLRRGGSVTSLCWPEHVFREGYSIPSDLNQTDIKHLVRDLPFLHRTNVNLRRGIRNLPRFVRFQFWRWL